MVFAIGVVSKRIEDETQIVFGKCLKSMLLFKPLWGRSWGPFGNSWRAILGPKRAQGGVLGACLGQLGATLGQIWLQLARLGSI